ncbi:MAG: class I SAM-dependent methyltransferase [Flavobacteriales bacterium]|nr:class I SAM-dependent methyltransferase [Flavobacteriales bacterium]
MNWFQVLAYFRYLRRRKGRHGVHSPLVYDFIENVLDDTRVYYSFEEIEAMRKQLLNSPDEITVMDYGAGSRVMRGPVRPIRKIARYALKPARQARMLFRLVAWLRPKSILEIGTSLGITSLYLHEAHPDAQFITLEGCPATAQQAQSMFLNRGSRIELIEGEFDQTLPKALETLSQVEFAFLDGNHTYAATKSYFEQIKPYLTPKSCVVLDDIHWSREMQNAWVEISHDSKVTLSLDLFHFGILFFDTGRDKEHFIIKM